MGSSANGKGKGELLSLKVTGLDCASCAEKIEKTLMRHKGVESVVVYLGTEKVEVRYDPSLINKEAIAQVITTLGYKVVSPEAPTKPLITQQLLLPARIGIVLLFIILGFFGVAEAFQRSIVGGTFLWDILAIIIGGYPLLKHAIIDLKEKNISAEVFMAIGVTAATAIGEFRSAAIIAFFMLVADFLDSFTIERSRKAIKELIAGAPKTARLRRNGHEEIIPVEAVAKGDTVVVTAGEKIPVEGVILSGSSWVNQAPITGESMPVEKKEGDFVYAATINQLGVLFIKVTHTGADTTYARIIKLVEEAESSKAPIQRVADKFALYFTPLILLVAVLTLLITGKITNAIAVLVVACPCTIAIATPLAVVAGMGKAAKRGIIIKGGRYLEKLAKVDTLVMDKTGTLTVGDPVVTDIKGFSDHSDKEIISYAAGIERYSEHPLARAIMKKAHELGIHAPESEECKVLPGMGVEARVNGNELMVGSRELLRSKQVIITHDVEQFLAKSEEEGKTSLLLSVDGVVSGIINVADVVREGTRKAIDELKALGLEEPVMLTGDNERTAQAVAAPLGIKKIVAKLLPEDKLTKIRELRAKGKNVLMIGDGINDAPALASAHVGIAMGAVGSDAAIEASDVALMRDELSQIPEAIRIGRKTFSIIKQNILLGICFNILGITLASTGILSPAAAAVAHIMPDMLVFINSSRLLR